MTKPPDALLTDRTTIETDWDCGQKRWWYKQHDGIGIVPSVDADYFEDGIRSHGDFAKVNIGVGWEKVADALLEVAPASGDPMPLRERHLRRLGWLTAYGLYLHPILKDKWDFLQVEKEMILVRGQLWIAFTADAIVRNKETGKLIVPDFKSVGMLTKNWTDHWPYAVQMHINIKGVEEELNEEVEYAQIIGMRKGEYDQGKLRHPYVWAYSDGGDRAEGWSPDWKRGWALRSVAEYPGGVDAWVRRLGPEVGMAQFPFSAPIMFDQRMFDKLIRERLAREQEVRNVARLCQEDESARDIFFPHNFNECRKVIGQPCPYLRACHNATVNANPLASGEYRVRVPHHDVEIEDLV